MNIHTCILTQIYIRMQVLRNWLEGYGVATISRLFQIIGLFCKRALYKRRYFAKETYNFKEPSNRSHPIPREYEQAETPIHIYVYTYTCIYKYIFICIPTYEYHIQM